MNDIGFSLNSLKLLTVDPQVAKNPSLISHLNLDFENKIRETLQRHRILPEGGHESGNNLVHTIEDFLEKNRVHFIEIDQTQQQQSRRLKELEDENAALILR